jgi:sugar phosphate isomerase/epimerase
MEENTMSNRTIRLAVMSLMWGQRTDSIDGVRAWLDDAVEAGYAGIACFDGQLLRISEEIDLAAELRDRDLSLASVDYTIDRDSDRLRRVCEIMKSLGAHHLVTLGGLAKRNAPMDEIATLLNEIGDVALEYQVRACYHNHSGCTGETMEETEALVGKTDPTKFFGFLDVGHATADFAGHPVEQRAAIFLQRNWERIDFLEFKDWSEKYSLCTDVGNGLCDYDAVFDILKDRKYSGWITVEQNGTMGDTTPLECARASREFIRKGLGV